MKNFNRDLKVPNFDLPVNRIKNEIIPQMVMDYL